MNERGGRRCRAEELTRNFLGRGQDALASVTAQNGIPGIRDRSDRAAASPRWQWRAFPVPVCPFTLLNHAAQNCLVVGALQLRSVLTKVLQ